MKYFLFLLIGGLSVWAFAACGGTSETEPLATSTPLPTATPAPLPTATAQPTPDVSLGKVSLEKLSRDEVSLGSQVAACMELLVGEDGAEAALSNLVSSTPEQEQALSECLLAASLVNPSGDTSVIACLTERLGGAAARLVGSGLLPLTDGESAVLGECVLAASATASGGAIDPIVACLEGSLDGDLARAVASGAVPLTPEQEALLGNCVLSTSLGGGGTALAANVVECLEGALGVESATTVASNTASLTGEQQAALGSCQLGSALETASSTVSPGVMSCLENALGVDVAQTVASAVVPLNAEEERVMGNCVLSAVLGFAP